MRSCCFSSIWSFQFLSVSGDFNHCSLAGLQHPWEALFPYCLVAMLSIGVFRSLISLGTRTFVCSPPHHVTLRGKWTVLFHGAVISPSALHWCMQDAGIAVIYAPASRPICGSSPEWAGTKLKAFSAAPGPECHLPQGMLKGYGGGQSLATASGSFGESCSQLQLSEGCLQHGAESRDCQRNQGSCSAGWRMKEDIKVDFQGWHIPD